MTQTWSVFVGGMLVGTGPRACPDIGQPQGVVPTIAVRKGFLTAQKYRTINDAPPGVCQAQNMG